jgi:hypothetical protein
MAQRVHENSLDDDNRRFVPDEVFETLEDAQETVDFLISCYEKREAPLVYPVLLKNGLNIGYVQAVPLEEGAWEIGYHIAKAYTGNGYATEEWSCCPFCGDTDVSEAEKCECCGEYFASLTDGLCDECYEKNEEAEE